MTSEKTEVMTLYISYNKMTANRFGAIILSVDSLYSTIRKKINRDIAPLEIRGVHSGSIIIDFFAKPEVQNILLNILSNGISATIGYTYRVIKGRVVSVKKKATTGTDVNLPVNNTDIKNLTKALYALRKAMDSPDIKEAYVECQNGDSSLKISLKK